MKLSASDMRKAKPVTIITYYSDKSKCAGQAVNPVRRANPDEGPDEGPESLSCGGLRGETQFISSSGEV